MNHPVVPEEDAVTCRADTDDESATLPVRRSRNWRRYARALLAAVTAAVFLSAGLLTHFVVRPGRLAETDKSLMRMQRMGPPRYLQAAYSQLGSDTVAIKNSSGKLVATGLYVEALAKPSSLPGFLSFIPSSLRHLLQEQASSYAAIFIAPIRYIRSRRVKVDTSSLDLPGVIVRIDKQLGLAAIAATMTPGQLQKFDYMQFLNAPTSGVKLPLLVMRRNPDSLHGSAGFTLTSGVIRNGQESCDTTVSGPDSGAPLAYVAPSGKFFLAGVALSSRILGKCTVVSSWDVNRFLINVTEGKPGRMVAFLGVETITAALARKESIYQGSRQGAFVASVIAGSPAAAAGLRSGDLIFRIDSESISAPTAVGAYLHDLRPGTAHTVTFVRGRGVQTVRVVLGSIPLSDESG